MKTAISLSDRTFRRSDRAARRLGLSRSESLARAAERWLDDLGAPRGSAPAPRRPVLVISADPYNRSSLRTVTVVVLTSTTQLAALPGNVVVPADIGGLPQDSVVDVTQVATSVITCRAERQLPCWPHAGLVGSDQPANGAVARPRRADTRYRTAPTAM